VSHFFIPTVVVLQRMREYLFVQEQINSILFGASYKKSTDFFGTTMFKELVSNLVETDNESKLFLINNLSRETESDNHRISKE